MDTDERWRSCFILSIIHEEKEKCWHLVFQIFRPSRFQGKMLICKTIV